MPDGFEQPKCVRMQVKFPKYALSSDFLSSWPSFWTPSTEDNVDSYLFTRDYFHILDTTFVQVIYKNVINKCFNFTQSKFYKPTFSSQEPSINQVQHFTNCPIQQSDPSSCICPIRKPSLTSPQPPISLPTWPLKSPSDNTSLVTNLASKS